MAGRVSGWVSFCLDTHHTSCPHDKWPHPVSTPGNPWLESGRATKPIIKKIIRLIRNSDSESWATAFVGRCIYVVVQIDGTLACQSCARTMLRPLKGCDCALCNFLEPCMAPGRPYKLFDSWFEFVRLLKRTTIHPSDPKMESFNGWWDGPLHDHSLWPKNWTLLTSFKVLKSKHWASPRQGLLWINPAANISFPLTKELGIITIFIIIKCWSIWVYMSGGFPS